MIRFEQITKRLGGRDVLKDLSFEIQKGEIFVIVGPSGTGKSVTLKHMVRLLTPTAGTVWVGDVAVSRLEGAQLEKVREQFGYLFQGGALLGWMSVFDNVALPLREKTRMTGGEILRRVHEVLEMVGLERDGEKRPNEISGGMQKRAGLARAIVRAPAIVLYDEPTSGLDPVTARTIDRLIRRLNKDLGVTSVVVTHDLQGALAYGTRIAMLSGGQLIELADPAGFVASQVPEVREFLESQFITQGSVREKDGNHER
jgi:phospholipid/cholesterol/gamma-HCH transport system ATP-binding protein